MKSFDSAAARYDTRYELERVRFERIFDAPARGGHFSFEAAGKRQYGVMLPGGDVPREGSQYAVLLAEKDNWQAIVAWRDLSTPYVYLRESAWSVVFEYAWLLYFFFPLLLGITLFTLGPWAALAALLLAGWAGAAYLRHVIRRNRMIEHALCEVTPPVPPGARREGTSSWLRRVASAIGSHF